MPQFLLGDQGGSSVAALVISIVDADLAEGEHERALVALVDAYARDPMGGGHALSAVVRETMVAGLRRAGNALVLLAYVDEAPVGVAVCFVGYSTFAARPLINVHDLAVLPAHRQRGVGTALLAAVEARALARGCCKITLEVRDDNEPARRLYGRFGLGPVRRMAFWEKFLAGDIT